MIYIKSELILLQMGANNIFCWSGAYDNCERDALVWQRMEILAILNKLSYEYRGNNTYIIQEKQLWFLFVKNLVVILKKLPAFASFWKDVWFVAQGHINVIYDGLIDVVVDC